MDGPTLTPPALVPHYYGDIVRKLFLAAGVIILIAFTRSDGDSIWVFAVDQALALLFFFALYYSIKSLRGRMVPDERGKTSPIVFEEPPQPEDEHPRGSGGLMG